MTAYIQNYHFSCYKLCNMDIVQYTIYETNMNLYVRNYSLYEPIKSAYSAYVCLFGYMKTTSVTL